MAETGENIRRKEAAMAQLTVETLSFMYTETGTFVFGPRFDVEKALSEPTPSHKPATKVDQVVIQREDGKPESIGSQSLPVVFANLEANEFDRLQEAVLERKAGDPPVTFEWTVGEYDFLTSFTYKL
jgi:hypothetical protein